MSLHICILLFKFDLMLCKSLDRCTITHLFKLNTGDNIFYNILLINLYLFRKINLVYWIHFPSSTSVCCPSSKFSTQNLQGKFSSFSISNYILTAKFTIFWNNQNSIFNYKIDPPLKFNFKWKRNLNSKIGPFLAYLLKNLPIVFLSQK